MIIRARFIGADHSMGYRHGQTYQLRLRGMMICPVESGPRPCPYESLAAFLRNWQVIENTDKDALVEQIYRHQG